MDIQLEYYRTFLMVARHGSFTQAGEAMGLTQSAVSQSIAQLEGRLQAKLFRRTARGAELTENGHTLMEYVSGLLDGVTRAEAFFKELRSLEAGSLRIGASDTLCRHLLLNHLKTFHERYPEVKLQVTNRTSGETLELLRQGRVDIGFVNLPLGESEGFRIREIRQLHDCFVYGSAFDRVFAAPVYLAQLASYPILMLETQSASRKALDETLRQRGISLPPQIELGGLDLLLDFAESNLGIAAVTREFIGQRRLGVVNLLDPLPPRQVGMVTLAANTPSHAAVKLMELIGAGEG